MTSAGGTGGGGQSDRNNPSLSPNLAQVGTANTGGGAGGRTGGGVVGKNGGSGAVIIKESGIFAASGVWNITTVYAARKAGNWEGN